MLHALSTGCDLSGRLSEERRDVFGQKHTTDVPDVDFDSKVSSSRGRPGPPTGAAYLGSRKEMPRSRRAAVANLSICSLAGVFAWAHGPENGAETRTGCEKRGRTHGKESIDVTAKCACARLRSRPSAASRSCKEGARFFDGRQTSR